jgi:hypothetical protein
VLVVSQKFIQIVIQTLWPVQGKSEQMMDYIKKLRACIRNFQQLEQGFVMEKESLENDVAREKLAFEDAGETNSISVSHSPISIEEAASGLCLLLIDHKGNLIESCSLGQKKNFIK